MNRSNLRNALLSAAACFAAGCLAYALQPGLGSNISWRPEAGMLLALLLLSRPESFWAILIAVFPAQMFIEYSHSPFWPFWVVAGMAAVHVGAAGAASVWMRRNTQTYPAFEELGEVFHLILGPGCLIAGACALLEVWCTPDNSPQPQHLQDWFRWMVRDCLGYFVVTPAVASISRSWLRYPRWPRIQILWTAVLYLVIGISAWFAFQRLPIESIGFMPFIYLPFPALVWASMRFGVAGATGASLMLAVVVIFQTSLGLQSTSLNTPSLARFRWIQLYLLVSSGTSLMLSVAIRERTRAASALEESERRTREIAESLKQAEKDVRRTEDLYRRAIEAANAVTYMRDYHSETFLFMGEGILALTGYTAKEMTTELWENMALEHVMRGDAQGMSYEEAVRRTRSGEFRRWQSDSLMLTAKGEERWIADSSVEVFDAQGKPIGSIGILMDVTDRKRAEVAIRRLNVGLEGRIAERTAELESAVRELEGFTYTVSHDLRAPLRAIEGFSRILQEDHGGEMGPPAHALLARIRSAAVRMDLLISNLLSFSRLNRETMTRQNVDLNSLVRWALEELRFEQRDRNIRVQHHDLPPGQGDPQLLRQVVLNLLSNALKYTRKREHSEIEIGSNSEHGEIVYFVRDNGTGFDMAYSDKLFTVFQRLHHADDFEGIGVGLSVAHRIIRRHGGRIWAESKVNEGATFYFTLEEKHSEAAPPEPHPSDSQSQPETKA